MLATRSCPCWMHFPMAQNLGRRRHQPTLAAAAAAKEARDAIRKAFPSEGDLRVHHLWSADGCSRFRANWFCEKDGKMVIVKSLLVVITKTEDGLVVQDNTVV